MAKKKCCFPWISVIGLTALIGLVCFISTRAKSAKPTEYSVTRCLIGGVHGINICVVGCEGRPIKEVRCFKIMKKLYMPEDFKEIKTNAK